MMTTSIKVNVTLGVDSRGKVHAIYSAANRTTALYLNSDGDLDFRGRRAHKALDDAVEINFSLLTGRLNVGADEKSVKFRFDAGSPGKNIDIRPAQATRKDRGAVLTDRRQHALSPKPKSFHRFASSSRTLRFIDDNEDHGDYKYTLYVASDVPGAPAFEFDPRIINQ